MIAALNNSTASGRYENLCIRTPRRRVAIPKSASKAVAIHPPDHGRLMGRLGPGTPLPRFMVVSVSVVVIVVLPGVNDAGANKAVVFAGRLLAVNVITFGNPVLPGTI
jgi:hypothetical protein